MKRALLLGLALVVAACGGTPRDPVDTPAARGTPVAFGPISRACAASGREGRSARSCGCIQAAADQKLTRAQQRRAVDFYENPHRAQEIRQSDSAVDERFWAAYTAYAARAEKLCG